MEPRATPADEGRNPLGSFLRARRARVRPDQHGLPAPGTRKVAGLRREAVARLAGVSLEYYVRLEQGRDRHPSASVVDALARVLLLDAPARDHLLRLAEPAQPAAPTPRAIATVDPGLAELIEQWDEQVCLVLGPYRDVHAANALATALNPSFTTGSNLLREVFLDPAARQRYPEWDIVAEQGVAALRAAVGARRDDPTRDRLVRELSEGSDTFARLWSQHDVRPKPRGRQRFRSPVVGVVELRSQPFVVAPEPSLTMYVFYAEPGSRAHEQLATLARSAVP